MPITITSLGAREELNQAVHGWGGITLHDIIDDRFARKAIEKGADGLIAVAAGAGGHAGRLSPFAMVQEIRQWFDGPLALSGSIATGDAVLAAQAMGADFGYIGSPFIATDEANADDGYKDGHRRRARAADIVYSNLFTGVHGNYLRQSIAAAGLDPDNLPEGDFKTMNFGSGNEGGRRPRRGATSGARARASARSTGSRASPTGSIGWSANITPPGRALRPESSRRPTRAVRATMPSARERGALRADPSPAPGSRLAASQPAG